MLFMQKFKAKNQQLYGNSVPGEIPGTEFPGIQAHNEVKMVKIHHL